MSDAPESSNFIRAIIDRDGGHVVTRFPPEPNGYLHLGHAKSICLNFGLALEYGGRCHLRMDDTNPLREDSRYVESIQEDVRWLGFDWGEHLYHASDYFGRLVDYAEELIRRGLAYVCFQTEEEVRATRGTVTASGTPSPWRDTAPEENLRLFERMRAGDLPDGHCTLRAKIDVGHANMKMRDPPIMRIRHAHHHRTGDRFCVYPLYDFAHCLSDSAEGITHSICTLEFENNRELYDWFLSNLTVSCRPKQVEFARLRLTHTVLSKRKLLALVDGGQVSGWDDPRMPTLAGLRRRGVTPEAVREFVERVGVAKTNSTISVELLESCIRDDLNTRAPRLLAVARPLKVTLTNWPAGLVEELDAPLWPRDVPKEGSRALSFSGSIFIERDDFALTPPKGWHRSSASVTSGLTPWTPGPATSSSTASSPSGIHGPGPRTLSENPVYLKSFTVKNFKCFTRKLTMTMPSDGGYAGWHVILGEGGSGKTSLLQGIALARLGEAGESERNRLCRQNRRSTRLNARVRGRLSTWFTVGYGASRRFTSRVDPLYPEPLNDRHETLFDEGARILCGESWVSHLYGSTLDKKLGARRRGVNSANLGVVMRVMGDLLALKGLRLADVDSRAVTLEGSPAPATRVRLSEIQDSGFAAVLNVALDLMRRISEVAPLEIDAQNGVRFAGTVLIDEVCAHLHPRWQREIGPLLCRVFPDLQFIVTTNSAFVTQAARPGGLFVLEAEGDVVIKQPVDSVQGMRSDQILTSPLFGLRSTRDLETERALQEREVLQDKGALSEEERARLEALEDWLSQQMSAPGDTFEEYKHYSKLQKLLSDDLDLMDET